jgi:FAD/FMN-containing dehydrogenase
MMKCADLNTLSILGTIALRGTKDYLTSLQKPFPSQGLMCRCPLAVIFPSGVRDVVATIAFCKDNAVSMSILNGGQDPSLSCVAGDLVLDMSCMSGVHVDLQANVVKVGAGTIFKQLDYELELHGVCVPGPIFSSIGVAGAFLGGGWGIFDETIWHDM